MTKRKSTKEETAIYKTYIQAKDRVTRTSLKPGGELRCSGKVSSSCSTSATHRVNLVANSVISRQRGKDREVLTTSETYTWSFVTHIFHNGQPSCGGVPAAPAYGAYISQLIRYSRACGSYQDFLDIWLLLTRTLLNEGFLLVNWSHHFESFMVATTTWLTIMEYMCHKWPRICFACSKHLPVFSSLTTYHRVCN
jgi:hypothetical protein